MHEQQLPPTGWKTRYMVFMVLVHEETFRIIDVFAAANFTAADIAAAGMAEEISHLGYMGMPDAEADAGRGLQAVVGERQAVIRLLYQTLQRILLRRMQATAFSTVEGRLYARTRCHEPPLTTLLLQYRTFEQFIRFISRGTCSFSN